MLGSWLHLGNKWRRLTSPWNWYPCSNWCLNIKCLYKSRSKLYSLSLCVSALVWKHIKAMHGYVWLCIKFVSNGTKSLTLKYFVVKKVFVRYPKRQKYFTTNNFHTKISNGEFSQTTVVIQCSYIQIFKVCKF